MLDEPRAPPGTVEMPRGGGRTLLQCLFVTQARWHQLTKEYDLREEAVVGGGEPRRLTALVGCAPRPTVFAHAWAQTDLTIGHLVPGEGALTMMESADFKRWGFGPLTVVESLLRGRLRWAWMCCRYAKALRARQTLWGTCVPLVARATWT